MPAPLARARAGAAVRSPGPASSATLASIAISAPASSTSPPILGPQTRDPPSAYHLHLGERAVLGLPLVQEVAESLHPPLGRATATATAQTCPRPRVRPIRSPPCQANTTHRHSSGEDIACPQWQFIAVEPQVNVHLVAFGQPPCPGLSMITETPLPVRTLSFRDPDHDSVPLIEPLCAGMAYGAGPPGPAGFSQGSTDRTGEATKSDTKMRGPCGTRRGTLECRGGSLWSVP